MVYQVPMSEELLCFALSNYLQARHPNVLFHFDFGSGTKLSKGQAVKQHRLNRRSWPDFFLAVCGSSYYRGLFLELKRDGTRLVKRNGDWASEHIAEQAAVLERLKEQGYVAHFAVGLDDAVKYVEQYLEAGK